MPTFPRALWGRIILRIVCQTCLVAVLSGVARAEEGRLIVRTFTPKDTGGSGYHWITTQDRRGVLYFGCNVVLSFDGERWLQHHVPGGHEIRGLAVGPQGRLWVGAVNEIGYFDCDAAGELTNYHSLTPLLPANTPELGDVWHVFAQGDGVVFVSVDSVIVWDGKAFKIHPLKGARRLLAMQVDGRIFVSHLTRGLWSLEGDHLQPFISAAALNHAGVLWLGKTPAGWLLVTNKGLLQLEGGETIPFAPEASEYIRKNILTAACRLPSGDLCVGTLSGGVIVLEPSGQIKKVLTPRDGLQSMAIMSLFGAGDGALWITSATGLARVAIDAGVSLYDAQRGLTGKPCNGVIQMGSRVITATDEGIFELQLGIDPGSGFTEIPALASLHSDLLGDAGDLYIASYKGLDRWRASRLTRVFHSENDIIKVQRSRSRPGDFLLANAFDLVRLTPDGHDGFVSADLARMPELPNSIAEDATGTIWTGSTARGIFQVGDATKNRAVSFRPVPGQAPVGPEYVGSLGDAILVATANGVMLQGPVPGEARVVAGTPHTSPEGISNEDARGRIWLAFSSPFADGAPTPILGRISAAKNRRAMWEAFAVPGLNQVGAIKCLAVDERGILWLGGDDGLLRIEPERLKPVTVPRRPLIHASMPADGELAFDQNNASFDFAALEFGRRESVRFQTRLSSAHSGWSAPTNSSRLTLAGLHDGDYEFAVRVVNDAGLTGPEAAWRFTVLPPWYRTKVAYSAWSILAIAGFFGLVHWRSAYLQRQNARLEALVKKKTELLERANAAKSEFLANMSHEIRNPISGIVGLSLAMEETALDQRQKTLTDSIRSCATLLATLVDDVLDFSKIEAGRIELRPAPFDLRASLAQCADMVKEDLRVAGGRVELMVAPDVPDLVVGDSSRVQQIVLNYLTNAVKFGAGKTVTLGAAPAGRDRVRLFVRDQGAGMSEAEAASLFTKFTRLDRTRSANIRGTGLGLAVCRLLATKMGGSVGVESKLGAGSYFWTELPLPPAHAVATPAAPIAAGPPLRALIVEDIDYNATAMQAVLRKLGIVSEVASDGPTALEKLQGSFYDVAFMDWNLPGMIGTEVVSRYRAIEPPSRRTVIIATTAYSADFNREACLQAGMDAFIAKPFTPEKISAALQDLRGSLRAAASVEIRSLRDASPMVAGIDLQLLNLLAEDSPEGLAGQIGHYLASIETDRLALVEGLASGDPKTIYYFAHRLASQVRMIQHEPLSRLAGEIQTHAATKEPDRLRRLMAEFDGELARLKDRLGAIRT